MDNGKEAAPIGRAECCCDYGGSTPTDSCDCMGTAQAAVLLDHEKALPDKVEQACIEHASVACGTACTCDKDMTNFKTKMGITETCREESCTSNLLKILLPHTEDNTDADEKTCSKHCHSDPCCLETQKNSTTCYKAKYVTCMPSNEYGPTDTEMLESRKSMLEGVCDHSALSCANEGKPHVSLQLLQTPKQSSTTLGTDCHHQTVCRPCDEDSCVDCQLEPIQSDTETLPTDQEETSISAEQTAYHTPKEMPGYDAQSLTYCTIRDHVTENHGLDKLDSCPDTKPIDAMESAKDMDPKAPCNATDNGGQAKVTNAKGDVDTFCCESDGSAEHAGYHGVKGPVRTGPSEDGMSKLQTKKPPGEDKSCETGKVRGVEKGDPASTTVDKLKTAVVVSGESCKETVCCTNSTDENEPVPMRAADPFTPEHSEEEYCHAVTYYLPIVTCDEDSDKSEIDLVYAHVKVHDSASNGTESGGGLSCTHQFDAQQCAPKVTGSILEEVEQKPGPSSCVPEHGVLFYGGSVPGPDCTTTSTSKCKLTCDATVPLKIQNVTDFTSEVLLIAIKKQSYESYT